MNSVWKISYREGNNEAIKTDLVLAVDEESAISAFKTAKIQLLEIGIDGDPEKVIVKLEQIEILSQDS